MNQTSNFIQRHARNRRGASQTVAQMQAVDVVDSLTETSVASSVPSREDIAIENESAIAMRRLDEAVLRLDRAVSIRKQREVPTPKRVPETSKGAETPLNEPASVVPPSFTSPSPPVSRLPNAATPSPKLESPKPVAFQRDAPRVDRSDRESGMHLDASVTGSTSIWMESEDQSTRLRIDRPVQETDGKAFNRIGEPLIVSGVTRVPLRPSDVTWSDGPDAVANELKMPESEVPESEVPESEVPEPEMRVTPEPQPGADASLAEEVPLAEEVTPQVAIVPTLQSGPTPELVAKVESNPTVEPVAVVKRPFIAAWQVDELDVPDTVMELFLAGEIAEELGQRIADAQLEGLGSIAITSVQPGEGRSTIAMGIALSVAYSGMKVALVDADAEGPTLVDDFGLELDVDWIDAIRDGVPIEEVAVASESDALTLIPLLAVSNQAAPTTKELEQVIERLKQSFDLVIVDCGNADLSVATLCDTALVVRDVPRTRASEVEALVVSLRRSGVSGVGIVENFCPKSDCV